MRALALCTLGAVLACPRAAWPAETIGVVAVAPSPGPSPALVDLTAQLRRSVSERTSGVLEVAQLRARMGDDAPTSSLAETNRMYEAARAAELSGDPRRAIAGLQATIEELESFPEGQEVFAQWSRAALRLAKIQSLMAGREEEARATLERLLRADPGLKVNPDTHGPYVAEACEAVRAQLARLERRRLTISSPSPGVRVYVNGREVGASGRGPVVLTLPRGTYRVAGYQGRLRAPPVTVNLSARDQEVVLDFAIPEILRPGQGPGLAASPLDATRIFSAAGFLRLDAVVATNLVENDGVTYLVGTSYDVRGGKMKVAGVMRLYDLVAPAGGVDALADFLLTGERKGPVAAYDPLRPDLRRLTLPGAEPAVRSTAKGWVAFGSGLGALALGGVALWQAASSNGNYDSARALLSANGALPPDRTQYDRFVADGDSARQRALIAGIGAGVCVATTAVLGYLAYQQTGEIGPFRF